MPTQRIRSLFTLFAVLVLAAACSPSNQIDLDMLTSAEIANLSIPEDKVVASGQPTQEQLPLLAQAGIKHVISLRTEGEIDWDESAVVTAAGMEFHSLPISGRDGVTPANAQTLEQLLASLDGQPVLLHCGSSNRVGALKAITALQTLGASVEEALAEGRRWGLTGMEPMVRTILAGDEVL